MTTVTIPGTELTASSPKFKPKEINATVEATA